MNNNIIVATEWIKNNVKNIKEFYNDVLLFGDVMFLVGDKFLPYEFHSAVMEVALEDMNNTNN